jgi:hypothetical protein
MTCSSYEKITEYSEIPKSQVLSSKIGRSHFNDYISHSLKKPEEYRILSGWITYKKTHSEISSYMTQHESVASIQYSKYCKIFIFLVNWLNADWLKTLKIYSTTPKIEMMFLLVRKIKYEQVPPAIVPRSVPFNSTNAYRFTAGNQKIGLKPIELEKIQVRPWPLTRRSPHRCR